MKSGLISTWLIVLATCVTPLTWGQSLNESLVLEDPAKLVAQARANGDIVRGAILFHQGNINCVKCHRADASQARIGPDLSRMDPETSDVSIVESILRPSKIIKQGYESTIILTTSGQLVRGQLFSQNEQQIVLRSLQNVDQLIQIPRHEIEAERSGDTSSMPDELANELKNRQQFLDLLRYVIDLKERGPVADASDATASRQRELSSEVRGWALINTLNCSACHSGHAADLPLDQRAPDLKWSAKWIDPEYLVDFISDPEHIKPGTSMPHLLGHLSGDARREAAEALVHYCVMLAGESAQQPEDLSLEREAIGQEAAKRGQEYFHTVGCVACHAPRDELGNELVNEQTLPDTVPLGDLTGKYSHSALTVFLEDPHAVRPSGRMPNMLLTHREALDLSSYLLQSRKPEASKSQSPWKIDAAYVQQGERLVRELNCVQCHTNLLPKTASSPLFPALDELRPDQGCLSAQPGQWPAYRLSAVDREYIQAALRSSTEPLSGPQIIDITLATFNCFACHSRAKAGGVSELRNPHFQTSNLNLGDQGRIPPTLTGVGAKLNAKWMRDVLVNHRVIRPYMKTRMPQYGEQNIGHLIELFQQADSLPQTEFVEFDDQKQMRQFGLELAGNKGLNCVACHTYQYKLSDTMPAVDLTEMAERLKRDWFFQYLLAPQKFSPNTVMPSYWPDGKAIRPDLAGNPKYQIEALWQYLLDGRQANAPPGVIQEPLEIVVSKEARLLRRSYEGVGKRGIGVGYPGGINLVFDAEQMRLATIWKGKFVNPAGVWYGQGHGMVRPLGPSLQFPKGPDLDYTRSPWSFETDRPTQHQFLGYILDSARRPTFRYRLGSVEVHDACSELVDEAGSVQLRRRLTISTTEPSDPIRFRVAAAADVHATSERMFRIDKQLMIRIVSDHIPHIVVEGNQSAVHVPLDVSPGQTQELVIDYLWE